MLLQMISQCVLTSSPLMQCYKAIAFMTHNVLPCVLAFHFIATEPTSQPPHALQTAPVSEMATVTKEDKASSQLYGE